MPHVPVEQRRTELMAAAVRVISRDGVAAASTRRIAAEAGTSQASVHYSFRSKEELLVAVTEYAVERTRAGLAAREFGPGLRPALTRLLVLFRDTAADDRDLLVAQYELQLWALHAPAHRDLAAHCYDRFGAVLATVLRAAARPDERDVDVDRLARLLMVVTDGFALQTLACPPDVVPAPDPAVVADGLLRAAREHPEPKSGSND